MAARTMNQRDRITRLLLRLDLLGDLDDHVRRLDHADRLRPDPQVQIVDGLRGHEADEAVWPGDDLHDRRDAVTFDARDDALEPVARRLGDDRPFAREPAPLVEQPLDLLDVDESLAAL